MRKAAITAVLNTVLYIAMAVMILGGLPYLLSNPEAFGIWHNWGYVAIAHTWTIVTVKLLQRGKRDYGRLAKHPAYRKMQITFVFWPVVMPVILVLDLYRNRRMLTAR